VAKLLCASNKKEERNKKREGESLDSLPTSFYSPINRRYRIFLILTTSFHTSKTSKRTDEKFVTMCAYSMCARCVRARVCVCVFSSSRNCAIISRWESATCCPRSIPLLRTSRPYIRRHVARLIATAWYRRDSAFECAHRYFSVDARVFFDRVANEYFFDNPNDDSDNPINSRNDSLIREWKLISSFAFIEILERSFNLVNQARKLRIMQIKEQTFK